MLLKLPTLSSAHVKFALWSIQGFSVRSSTSLSFDFFSSLFIFFDSSGKARTAKHHTWSTRASESPPHTDEMHLLLLEMRKLRVQLDRSERANHELRVRLELQLQGSPPTTQTGSEAGTRRSPKRSVPINAEKINVPSCPDGKAQSLDLIATSFT